MSVVIGYETLQNVRIQHHCSLISEMFSNLSMAPASKQEHAEEKSKSS